MDLFVLLAVLASTVAYAVGTWRLMLRSRFSSMTAPRGATGLLAFATLVVIALPTIDELADRWFWLHMVEHQILMAVSAPLLVLAHPGAALLWALPRRWRHFTSARILRPARSAWHWMTVPAIATVLHGAAIWAWHIPWAFDAAATDDHVHFWQHASFLGTALLFWAAIIGAARRGRVVTASGLLLFTSAHTGLLGALLFFSTRPWYAAYAYGADAIDDQRLAGLVMWIPAGLIYGGAALTLAAFCIFRDDATIRGRGKTERLLTANPN